MAVGDVTGYIPSPLLASRVQDASGPVFAGLRSAPSFAGYDAEKDSSGYKGVIWDRLQKEAQGASTLCPRTLHLLQSVGGFRQRRWQPVHGLP